MSPLFLTVALFVAGDVPIDSSKGKGGKAGLLTDQTMEIEGTERDYRLLVPKGLRKGTPLVFAFHGMGGNARRLASYCGLDLKAKKEKFILVYPSAIKGRWQMRQSQNNVDLAYFDALYDHICEKYPVDRNRVYATGMSMGGYFSNFIGAYRSDKIAAIAPHSGGLGAVAFTGVKAKNKFAVLVVHGDVDKIVPVSEGRKSKAFYDKAGHPVVYAEYEGLGHTWATGQKINDKIWDFFAEHPRGAKPKKDTKKKDTKKKGSKKKGNGTKLQS